MGLLCSGQGKGGQSYPSVDIERHVRKGVCGLASGSGSNGFGHNTVNAGFILGGLHNLY